MMRPSMVLALLLAVVGGGVGQDAVKKEPAKLVGFWLEVSPGSVPRIPEPERGYSFFEITADKIITRLVLREKGKYVEKERDWASYKLTSGKQPSWIDLKLMNGPFKGKTLLCIYKLEQEHQLTICLPTEADDPRPTSFERGKKTEFLDLGRARPGVAKTVIGIWQVEEREKNRPFASIALPLSATGTGVDPKQTSVFELGLDRNGHALAAKQVKPFPTLDKLRDFLDEKFPNAAAPPRSELVLRADQNATVGDLCGVLDVAAPHGFPRTFLQAQLLGFEPGRLELFRPHWRRPDLLGDAALQVWTHHDGINNGALRGMLLTIDKKEIVVPRPVLLPRVLKEKVAAGECVWIHTEPGLTVAGLVQVMDACRLVGFERLVLTTTTGRENDPPPVVAAAPPTAEAQADAENEIRSVYRVFFAHAKPPVLYRRLAQAEKCCTEPAVKYVLLREAAGAARRGGDLAGALQTLDRLTREHGADVWLLKLASFRGAPSSTAVVEAALVQAADASLQERQELAACFLKVAALNADKLKDPELIAYVEERRQLLKLPAVDDLDPFKSLPKEITPPETVIKEPALAAPRPTPPTDEENAMERTLAAYLLPSAGAILLIAVVLIWRTRRTDEAVRRRVAEVRKESFTLSEDEAKEEPEPWPDRQAMEVADEWSHREDPESALEAAEQWTNEEAPTTEAAEQWANQEAPGCASPAEETPVHEAEALEARDRRSDQEEAS